MAGRLGTCVDVVFGPNAFAAIFDAAGRAAKGGLTGKVDADGKGIFRIVEGCGKAEVGMFFPSEGTEATDEMVSAVRYECGTGVLIVVDEPAGELAVYMVDDNGHRLASAVQSE